MSLSQFAAKQLLVPRCAVFPFYLFSVPMVPIVQKITVSDYYPIVPMGPIVLKNKLSVMFTQWY